MDPGARAKLLCAVRVCSLEAPPPAASAIPLGGATARHELAAAHPRWTLRTSRGVYATRIVSRSSQRGKTRSKLLNPEKDKSMVVYPRVRFWPCRVCKTGAALSPNGEFPPRRVGFDPTRKLSENRTLYHLSLIHI